MKTKDLSCELNILVGGKRLNEYEHEGNTFVEGRKGSEFEVEYRNQTRHRVLVVPAVDGRSVFTGEAATPESRGYVVDPWSSIRIPGWSLDRQAVAKFAFDDGDRSYASQVVEEGSVAQTGVIGVLVYAEKVRVTPPQIQYVPVPTPYPVYPRRPYDPWNPWGTGPWWTTSCGVGASLASSDIQLMNASMATGNTSGATRGTMDAKFSASNAAVQQSASATSASAASTAPDDAQAQAATEKSFDLGTAFGARQEFKVRGVSFDRGDIQVTMSIFYASRRSLEKRGIQVARREDRHINELPQAFSGTGCRPPQGWRG